MKITVEAYFAFLRWRDENDPDYKMEILEAALAYGQWLNTNSIEKYLDPKVET